MHYKKFAMSYRPNVCSYREARMVSTQKKCVQMFSRMEKVWQKCGAGNADWCVGYQRKYVYILIQ